jgi:nucleotide-binding universal stress UspA family protein
MSGIVCAVRGGPDSQPTINKSISLSIEKNLPLFFIYIVNLDFLSHTSGSRTQIVTEELSEMGEFILLVAEEYATKQGVKATGVVLKGSVKEEIASYCHKINADYLVMGRPRIKKASSHFTEESFKHFIAITEEQTGAVVVLANE